MQKALWALAFGAFGFSASEYMMVGVLSEVAQSLRLGTAQAGHFLSAYALGVVTGALGLALFLRGFAPKKTLLWLAVFFALGNLLTAAAQGYISMLSARFLAGLPHGAFFTLASLVAERLARQGRSAKAVAVMFSGMTVATLAGVPAGTFLTHLSTWRVPYALIGAGGILSWWLTHQWMPVLAAPAKNKVRQEAAFLKKPRTYFLLLGVILGNGGIFCWLSYLNPVMTQLSGVPPKYMTLVMAWTGAAMWLGNWLSGRACERFAPPRVARGVQLLACGALGLIFLFPFNPWVACVLAFAGAGLMFALTVPEQMMLISAAPNGALLGSAVAQAGFYLGNTLGAFGGGIPLTLHMGYRYTSLFGLGFAALGWVFLALVPRLRRRGQAQTPPAAPARPAMLPPQNP